MTASSTLAGVFLKGTAAARPAANTVAGGAVYSATDTGVISQSDGSSWSVWATISSGIADPTTTRGDFLYRGAASLGRLALGAAGKALVSDGTDAVWGYPTHTVSENFLAADVSMTLANTFYNGPSLALAAGTYLLVGSIVIYNGGSNYVAAKLWDGAAAIYDSPGDQAGAGEQTQIGVFGTCVLGGATTVKISGAANAVGSAILAGVLNGVAAKASHLIAVRIA